MYGREKNIQLGAGIVVLLICLVLGGIGLSLWGSTTPPAFNTPRVINTIAINNIQPTAEISRPTSSPRPTARPTISPNSQSSGSSSSCSGAVVTTSSSSKGNYLHVDPCSGSEYDLGPLADGTFAVSPNDIFLVYVSAGDGTVYAAKIGSTTLTSLGNLKRDHQFSAFNRNETPSFRLSISDSVVTIYEDVFHQNATYSIPRKITE